MTDANPIHYAPDSNDSGVCGETGYLVETQEHVTCQRCLAHIDHGQKEADQMHAWQLILQWWRAIPGRAVHLGRDSVTLVPDDGHAVRFVATGGDLCAGAVVAFVVAQNTGLVTRLLTPRERLESDADEPCPATERNVER